MKKTISIILVICLAAFMLAGCAAAGDAAAAGTGNPALTFIPLLLVFVIMYVVMEKTTFGFQLKACGANRYAAKYAGIKDRRNIILSMAMAGAMAGAAGSLYYLSGNTEFFWSTYQSLPAEGFTGIAVALLAVNNPIGVIFSGIFMSMLNISGMQLTYLTAYNEYITDVIIAVIVYMSAFSLIIRTMLAGRKKNIAGANANAEPGKREQTLPDAREMASSSAAVKEKEA